MNGLQRSAAISCCLLALGGSLELAYAGAWTQPEGGHYAKFSSRSIAGNSGGRPGDGGIVDTGGFFDTQFNFYGEYGLKKRLSLIAFATPVGYATSNAASTWYMGSFDVGARFALLDGDWKLAAEASGGYESSAGQTNLMTSSYETESGGSAEAIYVPSIENARMDAQLHLGRGLDWGWFGFYGGYRMNDAASMDAAITGGAELGWQRSSTVQLALKSFAYLPSGDVVQLNVAGVGQTRYLGVTVEFRYAISKTRGLLVSVGGAPYFESNAVSPSLSVAWELR